ncbi:MAG: HEAT repeat domain-containing protein [Planctomycetota bacterium]
MQKFSWLIFLVILVVLALISRYSKSNENLQETKSTESSTNTSSLNPLNSSNPNLLPTANFKSLNEETSTEVLIQVFRGNLETMKLKAKRLLLQKKDAFPLLVESLEDPHLGLKLWCLKTLSDFRDVGCLPYVLPLLKNSNPQIIIEALETLQHLPEIKIWDSLVGLLNHSHPRVRLATIRTLAKFEYQEAIPVLLNLLKKMTPQEDTQDLLKGGILEAFAVLGNANLLQEIEPYLFSKQPKGIAGSLRIFSEWRHPQLYPLMIRHYQETQNFRTLELLSKKSEIASYFLPLLKIDAPPEVINLALSVIGKEKYLDAIDSLKLLLVNRPEFKSSITATLIALGVELTDIQEHAGALQGIIAVFELYPDLQEQIVWRRIKTKKNFCIVLVSQKEAESSFEINADERGRFRFPELKSGNYQLSVQENEFESYQTTIVITPQMVGIPINLLKKKPEIGVTFEVTNTQKEKIPQAKVRFDFDKYSIEKSTDQEGKVLFDNLIPGKYSIEIQHKEYQLSKHRYHWTQSEQVKIILEKY